MNKVKNSINKIRKPKICCCSSGRKSNPLYFSVGVKTTLFISYSAKSTAPQFGEMGSLTGVQRMLPAFCQRTREWEFFDFGSKIYKRQQGNCHCCRKYVSYQLKFIFLINIFPPILSLIGRKKILVILHTSSFPPEFGADETSIRTPSARLKLPLPKMRLKYR